MIALDLDAFMPPKEIWDKASAEQQDQMALLAYHMFTIQFIDDDEDGFL